MRAVLTALGAVMVLMGLLWIGQGLGWVRWPASSFMIDQAPWVTRGGLMLLAGAVLIGWARRRPR